MNYQEKQWAGKFGSDYIYRNPFGTNEMDELYSRYGITRTKLNKEFLKGISRKSKVLEVGCSVGTQLALLQQIGFKNLYGIEINRDAVELSKKYRKNIDIIQGSVLNLPFKDNSFDLVFASGVLMHIDPKNLKKAMGEMYRVSKKHIWGFDYYSPEPQEIEYWRKSHLVWKADYPKIFLKYYPKLKLIKERKMNYFGKVSTMYLIDIMYLLEK